MALSSHGFKLPRGFVENRNKSPHAKGLTLGEGNVVRIHNENRKGKSYLGVRTAAKELGYRNG